MQSDALAYDTAEHNLLERGLAVGSHNSANFGRRRVTGYDRTLQRLPTRKEKAISHATTDTRTRLPIFALGGFLLDPPTAVTVMLVSGALNRKYMAPSRNSRYVHLIKRSSVLSPYPSSSGDI